MMGKAMIKYLILAAVALSLGSGAAYVTAAILFTTPYLQLLPAILLPAGMLAAVSFFVGFMAPLQARSLAVVTAFPTVALSLVMSLGLLGEGRLDFGWPVVAIFAVVICLAGAQLACSPQFRHRG